MPAVAGPALSQWLVRQHRRCFNAAQAVEFIEVADETSGASDLPGLSSAEFLDSLQDFASRFNCFLLFHADTPVIYGMVRMSYHSGQVRQLHEIQTTP